MPARTAPTTIRARAAGNPRKRSRTGPWSARSNRKIIRHSNDEHPNDEHPNDEQQGVMHMVDLSQIREHMEIIGADGVHIGTVDKIEGDRIKMTKADSGSHGDHHHYFSGGLVAAVDGDQ
ncbi:hypothetical protein LTR94_031446, partial [Friedmanniomyces endolithicus]